MRLLQYVKKDSRWLFLIGVSFLFFILKLPSFFEPYWYGDEGVYEVIGFALRHGRMLYSGIWDNKPPLLYIIYSLFNGDQGSVRFFSFIIGLLTTFVFFFLIQKLFKTKKVTYILTAIFAVLFSLPVLEGNIANAENFMLLPIIAAGLILLLFAEKSHEHHSVIEKKLLFPGILLGIAFLIKVVAVFDFAAFFLFILFITYKNIPSLLKQIKILFPFVLGFILPVFLTALYFFIVGQLSTFIQSAFASNVGYVGYGNKLIIPQGLLLLKLLLLGACCLYLFVKRHLFSTSALFILLWTAFSVFNMFFSQRPYTHYVLVILPSLLLLFGLINKEQRIAFKKFFIVASISILLITIVNFSLLGGIFHKTFGYYGNFLAFLTHVKTAEQYYGFFDKNTPNDYALSEFINLHKNDNDGLFIWGNNAQVYRLTNMLPPGRYMVAYHVTTSQKTMEETEKVLEKVKPRFLLVSLKMSPAIPFGIEKYKTKFIVGDFAVYEKLF